MDLPTQIDQSIATEEDDVEAPLPQEWEATSTHPSVVSAQLSVEPDLQVESTAVPQSPDELKRSRSGFQTSPSDLDPPKSPLKRGTASEFSSPTLLENGRDLDLKTHPNRDSWRSELEALPHWLRRPIGKASEISTVQRIIKQRQIHTICEEGRCPNRGECYAQKTATFLLMGPTCTRSCAFCQVDKGHAPMPLDPEEPQKVAEAVNLLGLRYVVLTSVARDDLPDGGAGWFVATMKAIRKLNPGTEIEVLTADFWGGKGDGNQTPADLQQQRVATVVAAHPACYNHNIETVRRLQGRVRRGAQYDRSLEVLRIVKALNPNIPTKSGLMLGHGETKAEVIEAMQDLLHIGCDRLTLGQYMRPSLEHLPVQKYWTPEEFEELGAIARDLGFAHVRSGPLVRSSYHAGERV